MIERKVKDYFLIQIWFPNNQALESEAGEQIQQLATEFEVVWERIQLKGNVERSSCISGGNLRRN